MIMLKRYCCANEIKFPVNFTNLIYFVPIRSYLIQFVLLGKKKWEKQQVEDAKDEESRQKRADELKRQRSQEAKQLIGQRSTEARAVFERHSSQVKTEINDTEMCRSTAQFSKRICRFGAVTAILGSNLQFC